MLTGRARTKLAVLVASIVPAFLGMPPTTAGANGKRITGARSLMHALSTEQNAARRTRRRTRHHKASVHVAIVGGTQAAPGEWPWAAFVDNVAAGQFCTGTVVSSNVVLTAAHCAEDITTGVIHSPADYRIVTGRLDWTNGATGQVLTVSRVIVYPGFNRFTSDDDAALLILAGQTTSPAMPIATAADIGLLTPGTAAAIAGWGLTYGGEPTPPTSLQYAITTIQSPGYCAQQEQADGIPFNPATAICAVNPPSFAIGTCHGDSGGPMLAARPDNTLVQVGITSRGDPNCATTYPSVFTRADVISTWANGWIAAVQPTPPPTPAPPTPAPPTPAPPLVSPPASPSPASPPPAPPSSPPHRAPVHAPRTGLYRGSTGQRRSITLRVGRTQHSITTVELGYVLLCRVHHHQLASGLRPISPHDLRWTIKSNDGLGFSDVFSAQRVRYQVAGVFTTRGTISGTVRVVMRSKQYGICNSGRVRWRASR